jgi:hypothetical protein
MTPPVGGHWFLNGARGVIISTVMWIVVGVAAWMVVAAVVGVLIGRMIRQRDRQVPAREPAPGAPTRVIGSDGSRLPPAVGRGRSRPF